MKRVLLVLTAIALVFAVAGCGSGGAGGGAGSEKYTGTDKSNTAYTLTISSARAMEGDGYNLAIVASGQTLRSIGKVMAGTTGTSIVCGTTDNTFTVTVNSGMQITNLIGEVPLEGNGLWIRSAGDWDRLVSNPFNNQTTWQRTGIFLSGSDPGTITDGIILFNTSDSALLGIQVPARTVNVNGADVERNETSATGTKKIKIEYIADLTSGTQAELTVKRGNTSGLGNWADLSPAQYKPLGNRTKGFFELAESLYDDKCTWLWFQKSGNSNQFRLKIISVTWVD
jgi:hypothetical protein